ncbi:MAG TPA: prepilin peptidase [Stellaceae bacterium]|nr:prepilin peptidase [Stellaceae bacterium]
MPSFLDLLPLAGFAGVLATAAFEDCRRLVIPNALVLALVLLWPLELSLGRAAIAPLSVLAAVGCALFVFVVGAALFSRGLIGGGDVKLMAAAVLWTGAGGTPSLVILTGLFGGALALFLLTPLGLHLSALRGTVLGPSDSALEMNSVPYGLAIAAAALIVVVPPHFS